jgi:hypothetical protein
VLGVDYLDHQIEKLHGFAQQHGVADRVKGACMDVEKNNGQELLEAYPEHFDLVSVARFLHRYQHARRVLNHGSSVLTRAPAGHHRHAAH